MKKYFLLFCVTYISSGLLSQDFQYKWAISIGGQNSDWGQSIVVDSDQNVYATGRFSDSVDFDPGSSSYYLSTNGGEDIFLCKFDSTGGFIWAISFAGTGNSDAWCSSICLDNDNNVLLTGSFSDTIDFDPGPSVYNLTANGYYDIFICKFDSAGNFMWARNFGSIGSDGGISIVTDDSGAIYTTGFFSGTVDFDPGTGVSNLSSEGNKDIYIVKFSSLGNLLWAKSFGGNLNEGVSAISLDANRNIYITGSYKGTVDFDPGPGVYNLQYIEYSPDIYISKFDSLGNFIWAKSIAGNDINNFPDGNIPFSITVDNSGNVYSTGAFVYIVDFDPGPGVYNLMSNGGYDVFISKLNSAGNFVWAKSMGYSLNSPGFSDYGTSLSIDNSGNIYTTGCFWESVDFNPGQDTFLLNSNGGREIFLLKLDTAGNFKGAISLGGTGENDLSMSLVHDPSGSTYATGIFSNTVDFNPGFGQSNLTSNGSDDVFILKFNPCVPGVNTIAHVACVEYDFNGTILTNSGIYKDTVMSYLGCDSIITLDLIIVPVNISISQNGNSLTAVANGAAYQWINCSNGNLPVPGETNQVFTTTVAGDYAVIVTQNGCTDTSLCFTIAGIGISEHESDQLIFISLNSAVDKLTINISKGTINRIEVYNLNGQRLLKQQSNKSEEAIDISYLPPGNYFIRAISNNEVFVRKFVVMR